MITMRQFLIPGLYWFSAIGCGVMSGIYFAFSAFIMTSLARIAPPSGIAAMNAINVEIVRSLFMPLFLGTTLAAGILAALALFRWSAPGSAATLAAGILYVAGMFVVTMMINVPLNDALAAVDPSGADGAALWARYLRDWTFWNHIRTIGSLGASVLFVIAMRR